MSLRLQLLAFGSLTLVLPWAGMRFVQEMEATLRTGLEASLLASARTVAAALAQDVALPESQSEAPRAPDTTIYAQPLAGAPRLDGSRDDWIQAVGLASVLPGGHEYWTGTHDRYAYLFIAVADGDLVYQGSPGQRPYGDRLVLRLAPRRAAPRWLLLMSGAPGVFRPQLTEPGLYAPSGDFEDRIQAAWRESAAGFDVELRMPLELVGDALGIAIIDVDRAADGFSVATSASWPLGEAPGAFLHQRPELRRGLERFRRAGDRFRVLDGDGWVVAETGDVAAALLGSEIRGGLAERFFRFVLRREDPDYARLEQPVGRLGDERLRPALGGAAATSWFRRGPEGNAVVAAAVPIPGRQGAVLLEQASDSILTLTDRALLRLMSFTVLASVVAAAGLLGFATLLSLRVRRLAQAAETALGPKGEIETRLPGASAGDEIGDLSRSFTGLLRRLREHTQYLRTLTSKLSHELRTPLAIVSTSLDNLEQEVGRDSAKVYLDRLRDGAGRLDSIVVAMSEATRIEHAIAESEREPFDLHAVLESCCRAYRDVYRERGIVYRSSLQHCPITGSRELIAQLLDKLVDNAVGFSPPQSEILVALEPAARECCLSVTNRGPLLPPTMREQLFESLVSFREHGDGRPHLGLGLYIVALIVEFHRGRVEADNLADGSGVVFRVYFPRQP